MAVEKSKKRNFIEISSSEESYEEINSSTSCDDDNGNEDEDYDDSDDEENDENEWNSESEEEDEAKVDEDEECDDAYVDKDDEESICNKVIRFIRGSRDLRELKLVESKAYLRRYGLRVSGTKEECIERIKEHWRLKDRNGEALYPRSSFTINCTGDVCKGDVVLFKQKVYQKRGCLLGRRTVAGKIIKESYGVAKQQHTFTVEVLWSRGPKKLAPLFPLLVKGRNLYRLKTFRQRWTNEKERVEVLAEKHKRGAAARTTRDMRRTKAETNRNKSTTHKGSKRSGKTETTRAKKRRVNEHEKVNKRTRQNAAHFQASSSKQNGGFREHLKYPPNNFDHFAPNVYQREQHHVPFHTGSSFTPPRFPYPHPRPNFIPNFIPRPDLHSSLAYESRNFNQSFYPSRTDPHGRR